jgi:transcriptional regulator with XRE-family HTH domain
MPPETLANHLRKRRSELGLSQRKTAARMGIDYWTYLNWERGRTQPVTVQFRPVVAFLGFDRTPLGTAAAPVTLSQLFDGKDTLAIYSFMFGPEREAPCPRCTHFLHGLDGSARHIVQRMAFVVVAKSSIQRLGDWARQRG